MFKSLEGDGIIDNIYYFLWIKDTIFNTEHSIYIPQTIIYKYKRPLYWYFTSILDHKIKRKNAIKLKNEFIKEVFLKNVSKSGIVCYFIYSKKSILSKYETDKPTFEKIMKNILNNLEISNSNNDLENNNTSNTNRIKNLKKDEFNINSTKYIIEYYNKDQFLEFLNNKPKCDEGILQKFEDPKGEYNTIYRLIWSPKLSIFEKCSNLKKLNDKHYDIYERAVTYDGEEFQTKKEPVKGSHIPEGMKNIAIKIVNHIKNITLEKINIIRMILNFKIDKKDRIIFLWCSSLRLEPERSKKKLLTKMHKSFSDINIVDDSKINFNHPDNINIFKYSVLGKPINPHKEGHCPNCGLNVENYKLYEISFKNIIESNDNLKRDNQYYFLYDKINMTSNGIEVLLNEDKFNRNKENSILKELKKYNYKNFVIPKVIYELYPKLTCKEYNMLKKDIIFLNKKAFICDTCYLEITKYCSMVGSNDLNLLKSNKKDENNYMNTFRPKSANKFISKNRKLNLNNKNDILISIIANKLFNNNYDRSITINDGINLYNKYIANLNAKKKLENLSIRSYNDYNESISKEEKLNINKNEKHRIKRNKTYNRLKILSNENNKEFNDFFNKNKKKFREYAKKFAQKNDIINIFKIKKEIKKDNNINSNKDNHKKCPIKIQRSFLNSNNDNI